MRKVSSLPWINIQSLLDTFHSLSLGIPKPFSHFTVDRAEYFLVENFILPQSNFYFAIDHKVVMVTKGPTTTTKKLSSDGISSHFRHFTASSLSFVATTLNGVNRWDTSLSPSNRTVLIIFFLLSGKSTHPWRLLERERAWRIDFFFLFLHFTPSHLSLSFSRLISNRAAAALMREYHIGKWIYPHLTTKLDKS